jgi:arsenate reductase
MPRQPTWLAPASSGPGASGPGATGPRAAVALSMAGRGMVVFFGVVDDRRSRLTAALLAHRARGRVQAVSMSPVSLDPDPVVVQALADIGVDLLGCRPCPPSTELLDRAAVVVVMGYAGGALEGSSSPVEDWCIDDPCGKDPEAVRYIRDAIDRRVQRLLVRLGGAGPSSPRAGRWA